MNNPKNIPMKFESKHNTLFLWIFIWKSTKTVIYEMLVILFRTQAIRYAEINLCMIPANEGGYSVMPHLIGWAHAQIDPWKCVIVLTLQI